MVVEQSKDLNQDAKQITIEKLIAHPLISSMLLTYLVDLASMKQNHEVFSSMKVGITKHLTRKQKSQIVVAKVIVCMLASSSIVSNKKGIAKVLGVDKRNIRKALNRRMQLDITNNVFWVSQKKGRQSDSLPQAMRNMVVQFWTSQTIIFPNQKDVMKCYIGVKL